MFAVCTAEHCREGKIQILANVVALPGGGGMPLRQPKLLIPMHAQDLACKGGGRVQCHCEEGGDKKDLLHRSKNLQVAWNLAFYFFYS